MSVFFASHYDVDDPNYMHSFFSLFMPYSQRNLEIELHVPHFSHKEIRNFPNVRLLFTAEKNTEAAALSIQLEFGL